jgi:hypothetical protein
MYMSTIDSQCGYSFSFPPHSALPVKNAGIISVGGGYQAFIYLEIPPCIGLNSLKQARLILFKVPGGEIRCFPEEMCGWYAAYPLLDFYSEYGRLYAPPRIDQGLGASFSIAPNRCDAEIDVTRIASAWLNGSLENKGLMLTGAADARRADFGSFRNESAGLRPMLRLVCDEVTICQPFAARCCTVHVSF